MSGWLSAFAPAAWWRIPPTRGIDQHEVGVYLRGLQAAFVGYRIAQLSDLHFDAVTTTRSDLEAVAVRVMSTAPDLIVITGDFVTHRHPVALDDLGAMLGGLYAPDGVYAVRGNHDEDSPTGALTRMLAASGVTLLDNAVATIVRDGARLHIAGVDSIVRRRTRLDHVLAALAQDDDPAILLAHEPDIADHAAATGRFALQLSGHTHGGQIRLPIITDLLMPFHGRRYRHGAHYAGALPVYVNRGIGVVGLPLRFRCPPEVVTFRLDRIERLIEPSTVDHEPSSTIEQSAVPPSATVGQD